MSIHIKGKQIAAARQLAGLTLTQLAERAGVARSSIVKIENEAVQPREGTLADLMKTFAAAGVEFIEGGVRWTGDRIRTLEGPDSYLRLLDEVYQTLHRQPGAEVLFICVDDEVSTHEIIAANNRIREAGIKCRYLCSEEARKFDYSLRDYRLIPKRFYTNSVMTVFEDKVATLSDANNSVVIVRDVDQANMMRGLFEMIWQQSPSPRPPPKART
jgi:transcriptional regulator with XRE-family HTH domain